MTKKKNEVVEVGAEVRNEAEALISRAIDKNVPVETMERLLAMRRELKAEWAKSQYDQAMALFQQECPIIEKTKAVKTKAGTVAYRYAPIEAIVEQVKLLLAKHGFSYSTGMELKPDGVKVAVKVTHRDGHSEVSEMEVPFGTKTDVMSQSQVAAAAQTFAKRYAFCNAFGILTGDEDNDAKGQDTSTPPVPRWNTPVQGQEDIQKTNALLVEIDQALAARGKTRSVVEQRLGKPLHLMSEAGLKAVLAQIKPKPEDIPTISEAEIAREMGQSQGDNMTR